jgi:adenine deaminase
MSKKIIIIAGPNGAGKTLFARSFLPEEAQCHRFINADLIAAGLSPFAPEAAALKAGRLMLEEIAATMRAGKTVGGHYASPDRGIRFHAYVAGGPSDDHEGTRERDAIDRVRQGMRSMLRLGSAWYDVESRITAITEKGLGPRNFIL